MYRKLAPALLAPLMAIAACATPADDAAVEVRTGPAAAAALRAAPDAAADAGTAAFEMEMELSVAGQSIEMKGSGAYDADAQRMSMEIDMGAMFEELAGATGQTVPAGFDEPMQVVADGSTMYMKAPMLDLGGDGTGWVSLSADDIGAGGMGFGSYDPSEILESLRGVTGEPQVVGTETVRGVETTRYSATMDLERALAEAPLEDRERLEAQLDQLGAGEVSVDVWVDADGLPRRVQMDMGAMLGGTGLGADTSAVMTMEFFDYGEPVTIEVPSPDDVQDMSEVLGGFGGALGGGAS